MLVRGATHGAARNRFAAGALWRSVGRMKSRSAALAGLVMTAFLVAGGRASEIVPLPGTQPLEIAGDIASNLVAGVDRFLLKQLDASVERRARFWQRDFASDAAYEASVQTNRNRLARILGIRDPRPMVPDVAYLEDADPRAGSRDGFTVRRVRWTAIEGVHGEGLLLEPPRPLLDPQLARRYGIKVDPSPVRGRTVIVIPDADQEPEQLAGLVTGTPPESQFARQFAEAGYRVLVPCLVHRAPGRPKDSERKRAAFLSNREFLYRPAFELGRHLVGYELQMILAAADWLAEGAADSQRANAPVLGVVGWGEGGLLALYAGALDPRFEAVGVSGYFNRRESLWQEPIDRNVFGLLERFGDAELASLVAPRALIVEAARGPEFLMPVGTGAAPGKLTTPDPLSVRAEFERAWGLVAGLRPAPPWEMVLSGDGTGPAGTKDWCARVIRVLDREAKASTLPIVKAVPAGAEKRSDAMADAASAALAETRQRRLISEIEQHTQRVLADSAAVRQRFMAGLDTTSIPAYEASTAPYREVFERDVMGRFEEPFLPAQPRSRLAYDAPAWRGYEVVLDVWPDVIAYGVLLLPKDLREGEHRPVVVCQHGLEGRPQDIIRGDHPAYHDFAAKLAERGFITFAPQNLYLFGDRFRALQRKANPLGRTLFSIIVPQHRQITAWLKTLPQVDPARIAFYGLSYGGKTAMRVPALVPDYCLSICSADFNEWVWKNASTRSPYSYVWMNEYEIFEFDLGSTFNYAEMAALIAPRPFMVERGHFDGVAPDEAVAYEFAKVRHLYAARLKIPGRCEIEWFDGPHTIHGKGTFEFLHKHLGWPERVGR